MRVQVKASWQISMYYILMGASKNFLANPKVLHSNGGASESFLANPNVLHSNEGASKSFLANPKVLHSNGCQ